LTVIAGAARTASIAVPAAAIIRHGQRRDGPGACRGQ
jgi:hypothetical protein